MRSRGVCINCLHKKEGGFLPCNHPIAGEEMKDILFDSAHLALAIVYANIRKRLGLEFQECSWNVVKCGGREGAI